MFTLVTLQQNNVQKLILVELSQFYCIHFRVLQLMNLTDSRLSQRGSEKLEVAILSFFEQFRKIYVGDQAQKTSKVCTVFVLVS